MKELIKQDINFCEYPVWFQDSNEQATGLVWTNRKGYTYRVGYKMPTKTDVIFLYYLMLRSQQSGWKENITLTQREILKGCGLTPGKKPADRLKDSLERWKMVGIKFAGTFYDGKEYQTLSFGVIDEWNLEKGTRHLNVRFAPKWLALIKNSNYFRYIDFRQMKSLGSPLATRLYEILIKSFQGRNKWSIDALKLAAKIPMKEEYVADILPKIIKVVDIINAKTDLNITIIVKRPQRGQAVITFRKHKTKSEKSHQASDRSECNKIHDSIPEITSELTEQKEKAADNPDSIPSPEPSPTLESTDDNTNVSPQEMLELWNSTCGLAGLAKVLKLTKDRKRKIRMRMREYGDDPQFWNGLFLKITQTPFLTGHNNRGWRIDMDYVFRNETNISRIMEGKYDAAVNRGNNSSLTSQIQAVHSAMQNFDRRENHYAAKSI